MIRLSAGFYALLVSIAFCASAVAAPLAPPGDSGLRHDIQLLADHGLLTGPVTTWPVSWPQVAADLRDIPEDIELSPAVAAALARIRGQVRLNNRKSELRKGAYARGGTEPQFLRSFDNTPRADVETGVYADWINGNFAGRLDLTLALGAEDDQEVRLDGSWLGVALGNWMLAAGYIERYWGPAWQGGLIVSNNARPRPGITLRRLRSEPFETKWLSWIGPWHLNIFVEQLESDRAVSRALLAGMRVAFKPFQSLEIGISRTAQFGGEDRDVDFDTIANVITGQTTTGNAAVGSAENINTLAGGDIRWKLPLVNAAVYTELIGEDESGSRPDLFLGQFGFSTWGGIGDHGASWRLVYEYTDTKADLFDSDEREGDAEFGIAYNNGDFPTGYRYRGRSLGHPADGDALLNSLRLLFITPESHEFRLVATTGEVNRTRRQVVAVRNSLTPVNEDVNALDAGYAKQFSWGRIDLGFGFTQRDPVNDDQSTRGHGWVGYSREFY